MIMYIFSLSFGHLSFSQIQMEEIFYSITFKIKNIFCLSILLLPESVFHLKKNFKIYLYKCVEKDPVGPGR